MPSALGRQSLGPLMAEWLLWGEGDQGREGARRVECDKQPLRLQPNPTFQRFYCEVGSVAQAIACLPRKHKGLNLKHNTTQTQKRIKERKRKNKLLVHGPLGDIHDPTGRLA
jgi:hypothetical protein